MCLPLRTDILWDWMQGMRALHCREPGLCKGEKMEDMMKPADQAKDQAGVTGTGTDISGADATDTGMHQHSHGCEPQEQGDMITVGEDTKPKKLLFCERKVIYFLLMISAGMMGAYTFSLRGGVFCNAQTSNFVLMALALGAGQWADGFYYLIPIFAYMMGGFVSEILPKPVKKLHLFRWETYLVLFEMIVLFIIGWIPFTETHTLLTNHIVQVMINFIASMQYNTFRKSDGVAMATTFCTNHCRMVGVGVAEAIRHKDPHRLLEVGFHLGMLLSFLLAGIVLVLCTGLGEKTIWIAIIPQLIAFCILAYADLGPEHKRLLEVPMGH